MELEKTKTATYEIMECTRKNFKNHLEVTMRSKVTAPSNNKPKRGSLNKARTAGSETLVTGKFICLWCLLDLIRGGHHIQSDLGPSIPSIWTGGGQQFRTKVG